MSEAEHLSSALVGFFCDPHNGWFLPFGQAIKGLSAEEAAAVPANRFNSVWAVVNHVHFCQERVLLQLQGKPEGQKPLEPGQDWPQIGDPLDESAWQAACKRVESSNQALAETIAGLSDSDLLQAQQGDGSERWKLIQGVLTHNCYHTCEIISIRHMQGMWLEEV
jgi:hypothetical protein